MSRHPSDPPADWPEPGGPAMAGYPSAPDYPATPDYPPPAGYQPVPGGPDYPPAPGPLAIAHDEYSGDHQGLTPGEHGVAYDEYRQVREAAGDPGQAHLPAEAADLAGPADPGGGPADPGPAQAPLSGGSTARTAMLAYLTVPLFGFVVPLVVYLRARHGSTWTRAHAAQALNVWITVILYDLSAAIMGTMLALDSPQLAMIVFGPLVVGLWLVALVLLVRAATAASQGQDYTFPGWLCSRIVH